MGLYGNQRLRPIAQGQNTDVDAAAEALTSTQLAHGVILKALEANTDVVYVNFVETATVANGYPLGAGDSLGPVPVRDDDLANISCIGGAVNQAIAWIALGY